MDDHKSEQDAKGGGKRRKRGGYMTIIALMVIVGAVLVVQSSFSGGRYSMEIADIQADPGKYMGHDLKVVGKIKEGTAETIDKGGRLETHFTIHDGKGNQLPVLYPHNPPDPFKEGRECIVEGTLDADGVIQTRKLTVKCPSKYQTEDGQPIDEEYYRQKYGSRAGSAG